MRNWRLALGIFLVVCILVAQQPIAQGPQASNAAAWQMVGTLGNNGAAATTNRVAILPGIVQTTPANGSAFTQGRNVAPNIDTAGNLWVSQQPALRPASYRAAEGFAASSTTDNSCIYGNATNTVLLYSIRVSGTQTTSGMIAVEVTRRSTAESGGTATNFLVAPDDTTNYPSASTTPVYYVGTGPTRGTGLAVIDYDYIAFLASSTTSPNDIYVWNGKLKPQVLIGTSQGICIDTGSAAITGGEMSVTYEWEEIANISE